MPYPGTDREARLDGIREQERDARKGTQTRVNDLKTRSAFAPPAEKAMLESQIEALNMDLHLQLRGLELERRAVLRETGNNYRPDFDGIVTATYLGIDSTGAAITLYKGKQYKTIRKGITSLRRGELVQMYFSGNSYYSDWS